MVGDFLIISHTPSALFFQKSGPAFGKAALTLLGIVVLPGILGRFDIQIPITRVITLFRRQLGILTFLLAFTHYQHVRFAPKGLKFDLALFEVFGILALSLMALLFLTSNNLSVAKMGKWWKRLHRLIYVILWLVVLHTALQSSKWTALIGVFAALEIISLGYSYLKKGKI